RDRAGAGGALRPPRGDDHAAAAPRRAPPACAPPRPARRAGRAVLDRTPRPRRARLRQVLPRRRARPASRLRAPTRRGRVPAHGGGGHRRARLPHGLTLRHFPQSFEFSSLGGWIATRSGGHYATLYTHIDEFVESLRVITPAGVVETRRLPGSGAGPSPDRLFIGSEGILGVITEAWMRLQDRPTFRASAAVTFADFVAGAAAARALAQAGLYPANCRLLDPGEAATAGAGSGEEA